MEGLTPRATRWLLGIGVFYAAVVTRRWRALWVGVAVALALTLGAMLPYGPAGAVRAVLAWGHLGSEAAPFGAVAALGVACVAAAVLALRRSTQAPLELLAILVFDRLHQPPPVSQSP